MRNYSVPLIAVSVGVLLTGALFSLASGSVGAPSALIGGLLALGILAMSVRLCPDIPRAVVQLVLAAALVRMAAAIVCHLIPAVDQAFAPDAPGYDMGGRLVAQFWSGEARGITWLQKRTGVPYYYLVGAQYYLFGYAPLLPKFVNAVLGGALVLYAYRIGRVLGGDETGWRAGTLVMLFPSLILWSVLNIRDALAVLLVAMAIWHTLCLKQRFHVASAVHLAIALLMVGLVRDYMLPMLGAGVLFGFLVSERRAWPSSIAAVVVVGAAVFYMYTQAVQETRFVEDASLEGIDRLRRGGAMGAKSGYLQEYRIDSPLAALMFLPLGLGYFLLSPFPWQIGGIRHLLPLPEMLYWYSLLPMVWLGIRHLLRTRFSLAMAVLLGAAIPTIGYAYGSSNVGTAYRHRAQIMPYLLCFAAAGMAVRDERRRRRPTQVGVEPGPAADAPARWEPAVRPESA
jgi:hypothetical protein